MSNFYTLTGEARRDLAEINGFIIEESPQAANRFLRAFNKKCQLLAQFPEMGRAWNELRPPLRSFPIDRYLIFYCPVSEGIQVVRVLSGYRDLEAVFSELAEGEASSEEN
jgi:toxin ParE1/3/4